MQDQIAASREDRRAGALALAGMLDALNTLPQPLIGRVHGNAFGGGVGLACVCDVAIGVTGAKFGLTETKLGLVPATIGPYVVARMGEAMARRVFMSSRVFGAEEAVTLGVIAKAVAPEALDAAIEAEARALSVLCPEGRGCGKGDGAGAWRADHTGRNHPLGRRFDGDLGGRGGDSRAGCVLWEDQGALGGVAVGSETMGTSGVVIS